MELLNRYFFDVVKNHYFDFEGRASRSQFWYYVLFTFLLNVATTLIERAVHIEPNLSLVVAVGLLLPGLGISVRRLHDIGKSGWWLLAGLVPLLGFLLLFYFYLLPSQAGSNLYGESSSD
jgi:uncharacterized membrane protein YhaH (DUF805 family)